MRYAIYVSLLAASLLNGAAIAQQTPAPPTSAEPQKPGPSNTPEQQRGVNEYLGSKPGQNGKMEPSTVPNNDAKQDSGPVLVNGALNVPGAPTDSQTVPAKFSARNAALDKLPILAWSLALSDGQKKKILEIVQASNSKVVKLDAKVTEELLPSIELSEFSPGDKSEISGMNDIKFVRAEGKVLLVYAPNRIVVGEIGY